MNVDLKFENAEQETFYWKRTRNNEFDGAFANGKTYVGCMRAFTHLMTFSCYAMSICRQEYKRLRQTTMKTFFKICPDNLIYKHDEQQGLTVFINKSFAYWMHLDDYDEQDLRGLEVNSALIDQAEETKEKIYSTLDLRIGRWDQAKVPQWLLRSQLSGADFELSNKIERDTPTKLDDFINQKTLWPRHPKRGFFLVPNYMDVLCNIADEDELHWTYRFYNPESPELKPDHSYVHREMDQNMNDPRSYQQAMLRDQEYIDKYILGKRGKSKATIHTLDKLSIINPEDYKEEEFKKLIKLIQERGALYRILDHGETGVTCCLWGAALNNIHIFYREYYVANTLISANRQNIWDLSIHHRSSDGTPVYEEYQSDYADPDIFKQHQQKISGVKSGFWTVANEYSDTDTITAMPIFWAPADNNEHATRNRINELLVLNPKYTHPITKVTPAPGIYFIKSHPTLYPYGCQEAQLQLKAQRKVLLGSDNGKNLYSIERDEAIVDHAYDCIRYYVAMHNTEKTQERRKMSKNSFAYYNALLKRRPRFMPASI